MDFRNDLIKKPEPFQIYRHFKGRMYEIICIAKDSENGRNQVVYRALYEPYTIYTRDMEMFLSPVDKEKYPNARQRYRFELYECENISPRPVKPQPRQTSVPLAEQVPSKSLVQQVNDNQSKTEENASLPKINPYLARFLDARGYEEQLECLSSIKENLTPEILTPIEFSIGMEEAQKGDVMERYRGIKNYIMLKQRYEKSHR